MPFKSHLTEFKNYYTALDKMEEELKKGKTAAYRLGVHAAFEKIAIGTRQVERIVKALPKDFRTSLHLPMQEPQSAHFLGQRISDYSTSQFPEIAAYLSGKSPKAPTGPLQEKVKALFKPHSVVAPQTKTELLEEARLVGPGSILSGSTPELQLVGATAPAHVRRVPMEELLARPGRSPEFSGRLPNYRPFDDFNSQQRLQKALKEKTSAAPLDLTPYLSMYTQHDPAHGPEHAETVRQRAAELAAIYAPKQQQLVDYAAVLHDIGLSKGRETHEQTGAQMIAEDPYLQQQLSPRNLRLIREAVRQHRASTGNPRSIIGRIISDADRAASTNTKEMLERAMRWGEANMPHLTSEGQLLRAATHLQEKYSPGGSGRRTYFPESEKRIDQVITPLLQAQTDPVKLQRLLQGK